MAFSLNHYMYMKADENGFVGAYDELCFYCGSETVLEIPARYTSIADVALYNKPTLERVILHAGIRKITDGALSASRRLTAIEVDPENPRFKSIDGVLYSKDGKKLICYPAGKPGTRFAVPGHVVQIASDAFAGCEALAELTFPASVTKVGSSVLFGCSGLTAFTLPAGVQRIGRDFFRDCTALSQITLPDSLSAVGTCAFLGCTSLTEFTLPAGLTVLPASAFVRCTALRAVYAPGGLQRIGDEAFRWCAALEHVDLLPDTVLGKRVFMNTPLHGKLQ